MRSFVVAVNILMAAVFTRPAAPADRPARRLDALPIAKIWTKANDGAAPVAAAVSASHLIAGWPDHLAAFSLATGERDWSLPIPAARIACDATFCVVADDSSLRGIDLSRTSVAWQKPLDAPLASTPTLRNGWLIIAPVSGALRALHMSDGREIWHSDAGAALTGAASINGDRVAVATRDSKVTLFDLTNGRALWTTEVSATPGAPRLGGGRVIVGLENGRLDVLDEAGGKLQFEVRTGAAVTGAPSLDDERIYAAGQDGVLRAFDRGNGAQRWYVNLPTRAAEGPMVDGDLIIVPLRDGAIDIRLNDGKAAAALAAPGGATSRLALPPIVAGGGAGVSVLTATYDPSDMAKWSLARHAAAPAIIPGAMPRQVPGRALTLTPPR